MVQQDPLLSSYIMMNYLWIFSSDGVVGSLGGESEMSRRKSHNVCPSSSMENYWKNFGGLRNGKL